MRMLTNSHLSQSQRDIRYLHPRNGEYSGKMGAEAQIPETER
jgi:hypothetical protein